MSEINHTLNTMIGNTYQYKGTEVEIKSWTVIDGQYIIETDDKDIRVNKSDMDRELDRFRVLPGTTVARKEDVHPSKMQPLEEVLLDTIQKVQKDKGYVDQAKAINSSVSNMVNIQKLKLQMIKQKDK